MPAAKTPAPKTPAAKTRAVKTPVVKKTATAKAEPVTDPAVAAQIAGKIEAMVADGDWRGPMLATVRALMHEAEPAVLEELKWRGVPCWSRHGLICTGETYKLAVKMTFAHGAALPDPKRLFNASLDGNVRRAIDFHEGDTVDGPALKALIRAAVAYNEAKKKR